MTNLSNLTRWSGLTSMLGGALFAIGVAIHPLRNGQAVNESPYTAIHVLIAVGLMLVLYVIGVFSLPVLGPESVLVTIIETIGALPFGLGFIWWGYALWSRRDVPTKQQPSRVRQAGLL